MNTLFVKSLPEQEIINDYLFGLNMNQIAEKYNCSSQGVRKLLIRNNTTKRTRSQARRKFQFNESYFEVIDNSTKAYWLGFIAADGTITERGNSKSLTINLQWNDKSLLDCFKSDLEYDGNIYELPIRKRNPNKQCVIRINSYKLCTDLSKYYITPRKSFTVQFPEIDECFYKDYIRGYFDGDGCISINKYGKPMFTIVSGSKIILEQINKILSEKCHIEPSSILTRKSVFTMGFYSKDKVKRVFQYLYTNADRFLERKFNKFAVAD